MQTITTPSGDTLIVLPQAEYEALIDAADIAMATKVRADIKAGDDELIPSDILDRLLEGDNPIKVWREFRGLTGSGLAEQAGLSRPYISQIETGQRQASVKALSAIAEALNVEIGDLVG